MTNHPGRKDHNSLSGVGLLKLSADDTVTKGTNLRFAKELAKS